MCEVFWAGAGIWQELGGQALHLAGERLYLYDGLLVPVS